MRLRLIGMMMVVVLIMASISACDYTSRYAKRKLDSFARDVGEMAARPKTPEEACRRRGGIMYNDQCYAPDPEELVFDEDTCRMRGGLYIDEECLFAAREE